MKKCLAMHALRGWKGHRLRWQMGRLVSTKVDTASEAAARMMDRFGDKVLVRREVLDRGQLSRLALTLNRPVWPGDDPPSDVFMFTKLPPGWHLVYFTPDEVEAHLGRDGSDQAFNAPKPFTRRMWAGGKMEFRLGMSLRTDLPCEEHTRLVGATAKRSGKTGEDMVLVEVEKKFYSRDLLSVTDRRSWIFRPSLGAHARAFPPASRSTSSKPSSCRVNRRGTGGFPAWRLSWSPVGLFRFSALTFNAHKIHYNEDWARAEEGHPAAVVHGPLNLLTILEYWRSVHGGGDGVPREVSYRAMSPVYAGDEYGISTAGVSGTYPKRTFEVLAERDGVVIMKAIILEEEHALGYAKR